MKYSITILALLTSAMLFSQGTYLRFDVFQFDVGDEFQYRESRGVGAFGYNSAKHSHRVIGVSYNADSTVVEYTWFVETKDSWLDNNYNWSTSYYTDTLTDLIDGLDLTLAEYDTLFNPYFDTTGYGMSTIPFSDIEQWACDSTVQGYYYSTSFFEGYHFEYAYGLGLGCVTSNYVDGTNPSYSGNPYHNWGMTGFVKDGDTCGYVVSTALDVHDHSALALEVYPNPSSDFISIKGAPENATYCIINLSGQLLASGELTSDQQRISVSNLRNGLFIIQIEYNHVVWVEKLRVVN
ncbi:MAG: T9SS type A sorting domain-containing protein [Bacteroidetes bacterium]|nr:MAG: T9SS type A sorting domain-containing protein [Bacteroidota bacterium]